MTKPNFFIVGAAKSGTTSVWQYLKQHPQVFMPDDELYKEPCYFSSYGESLGMARYLSLFSRASSEVKMVGEASSAYLTDPLSSKRIHDFNPAARILIFLRNPADRAYSLYNWMVQDGYEYSATFEDAFKLEAERSHKAIPNWFEPQYYWNYMYVGSGFYHDQVKRFIDLFGQNVMIFRFDELTSNTISVYDKVCDFLEIERRVIDPVVHNPSRRVVSPKVQFILRKLTEDLHRTGITLLMSGKEWNASGLYIEHTAKLASVERFSLKDRLMGALIRYRLGSFLKSSHFPATIRTKKDRDQLLSLGLSKRRPARMANCFRRQLIDGYKPDIERLSELTRIDFSGWLV